MTLRAVESCSKGPPSTLNKVSSWVAFAQTTGAFGSGRMGRKQAGYRPATQRVDNEQMGRTLSHLHGAVLDSHLQLLQSVGKGVAIP